MADITTAQIKELREKTGAGIMDAKKALQEVGGDMDEAVDFLRKKGLATAEKKSSRTAAEGLVSIALGDQKGAIVEVNAETDFVARNEKFQTYVSKVSELALENEVDSADELAGVTYSDGNTVDQALTDLIAKIGENMNLRRADSLTVENGVVAGYMHNSIVDDMGKIGVLVALESEGDEDKLDALGKQLAMHIAAAFPKFLNRESVDPELLEREKAVLSDQARASGKPEEIIEKMVEGRMRKYFEEIVLLDQTFVIDGETRVSEVLEKAADTVGAPVELKGYVRFQLGEGIEKEEEDFAAEVAAAVNG